MAEAHPTGKPAAPRCRRATTLPRDRVVLVPQGWAAIDWSDYMNTSKP